MKKQSLLVAASLAALLVSGIAEAAKPAPMMKAYRYKNDKGQMVIENALPPEQVTKGYQVINAATGQVLEDVPPSTHTSLGIEEERSKAQQAAEMQRRDGDLRKLYSSPQDAERQRDRQIDGIRQKLDFAKGQLLQLNNKRKAALEQAAALERKGQVVPKEQRANIDRLNTQIAAQEEQVKGFEADIQRQRDEFDPVIERLKVIYPGKAAPAAAPAAPAAPAAATPAPAAKPAAR